MILILGATGQIGKELMLELNEIKNINCIAHSRSFVAASFFKKNKIKYVVGKLSDDLVMSEIKKAVLIFDLAAPDNGSLNEIKKFYKNRLELIISNMQSKSSYIFASTMNAFGIDNKRKILKNYLISSSIYATNKRYAEKYLTKICIKRKIEPYIFRLAEVHGNLQRASINIQSLIKNKYLFEIPSSPAWIVTIKFLKFAILNIFKGLEKPGMYTLTNDNVYWHELLILLGKKINYSPKFIIINKKKKTIDYKNKLFQFINSYKDIVRGNIGFSKSFEENLKLNFRINKLLNNNQKFMGAKTYKEYNKYIGILPGKRLTSIKYNKIEF